MRLQKFLAQAGVSSRRKAEALIASGAVRVNGVAVTTLGTSVKSSKDRVDVDGRRVVVETPIYRLLLKPRACLATLAKSGERPTRPPRSTATSRRRRRRVASWIRRKTTSS